MAQLARLSRATKCRGCGKEICFIKSINGKSIPVDPDPISFIPEADYDKFVMMDGTVQRGQVVEETVKTETVIGYRSHWATCPAAEDFRRKKNKSERTKRNEQAHTDD